MSREETLARVDADLSRGHTYIAAERLAGLTTAFPGDMEIRARRAAVNHQIGNFLEAGRWGYLTEDVDPDELAAFEHAFKSPWDQLRALKLRTDPSPQLGPVARERFDALTRRANAEGPKVAWTNAGPGPTGQSPWGTALAVGCAGVVALGFVTLVGLAVYGFLKLFNIT